MLARPFLDVLRSFYQHLVLAPGIVRAPVYCHITFWIDEAAEIVWLVDNQALFALNSKTVMCRLTSLHGPTVLIWPIGTKKMIDFHQPVIEASPVWHAATALTEWGTKLWWTGLGPAATNGYPLFGLSPLIYFESIDCWSNPESNG